jgi:hypothetical protein
MHMDVFHRDLLLALAAMMIQRIEQHGIGPGKLVRLAQVLASRQADAIAALVAMGIKK